MGSVERKTVNPADKTSFFQRTVDWISEAQGSPWNITFWLVFVITWTFIFMFGGPHLASGDWLPKWFTSQGYNFPLNLVTTVAELFIGFLVAAATNRAERALMSIISHISTGMDLLRTDIKQNTELTEQIHIMQKQQMQILDLLGGTSGGYGGDPGGDSQPDQHEHAPGAVNIGGVPGHAEPADAPGVPEAPGS